MGSGIEDRAEGLLSIPLAARLIGIHPDGIYKLIRAGGVRSERALRPVHRLRRSDVIALAAQRAETARVKTAKRAAKLAETTSKQRRKPPPPPPQTKRESHHRGKRRTVGAVDLARGWSVVE